MKLRDNNVEIEKHGDFDSIDFRASTNNNYHIFKMLTTYSNPIESVVREYTSNCFDSHKRANVDKPVVIRIKKDDGYYVEFEDFGTGLTKEQVKDVFTVIGESDKRDSNDEIGGFGIGAKSACGYLRGIDLNGFIVDTYVDGTHYSYLITEESNKVTMNNVYTGDTERSNGTIVRIPFLDSDLHSFKSAVNTQLLYFDNIQYQGLLPNIDYTIVKGDHFVISSKRDQLNNYHSLKNSIHACIGQVAYPLDFSQLSIRQYSNKADVPVALKFDVGEIDVTPKREQIEYNDRTIQVIEDKITKCFGELQEMLQDQHENVDSIEDSLKHLTNPYKLNIVDEFEIKYPRHFDYDPVIYLPDGGFIESYTHGSVYNIGYSLYNNYNTLNGRSKSSLSINEDSLYYIPEDENASHKKNRWIGKDTGQNSVTLLNRNKNFNLFETSIDEEDIYKAIDSLCDIKDYQDINVPENKNTSTKSTTKKSRDKDEFPIKYLDLEGNWNRSTMKESNINTSHTYVYGARADDDNLKLLSDLRFKFRNYNNSFDNKFVVLKIAKSRFSIFEELPHSYHIEEFLSENNRIIRRYLNATEYKYKYTNEKIRSGGYSDIKSIILYDYFPTLVKKHNSIVDKMEYGGNKYDSLYSHFRDSEKSIDTVYTNGNLRQAIGEQLPLLDKLIRYTTSYKRWNEEAEQDFINYIESKNLVHPLLYIKKNKN